MKIEAYKCNVCNVLKGEGNHWFKFRAYPDEGNGAEFVVKDWNDKSTDYPTTKHLCSDGCVIKTVQGWLSTQKELSQKSIGSGEE